MSQQSFNPYEQWLGIAGGRPTNFYELLGLRLFENNVQTIAQAIESRTAQVRGVRPGLQVEEWRKVLAQLNSAKATLLDVAAKARYDATLRGNGPRATAVPQSEPRPASADPPQRTISAATPPPSAANVPPAPIPYATPVAQPVQPAWGSVPTAIPVSPSGEAAQVSQGQPVAAAIPVQPGTAAGPEEPHEMVVGEFSALRSQRRRPARKRSLAIGVPVALVILIAVAGALAYQVYQKRQATDPHAQISQAEPAGAWQQRSWEPAVSRSGGNDVVQKTPLPVPTTPERNSSRQGTIGGAADRPSESAGDMAAMPPGSEMATVGRGPAESTQAGTPSENPAFLAAVKKVFSAMAGHDVERARRELKSVVALAETEAEKAEIARLETIVMYLDEFWKQMSRVVAGLEGGEVFTFDDEPIVVVEGTSESLVLRGQGQNREYSIRSIPARMVMRLAETYFRSELSRALYGVFLAVDPKGDPARARQLWENAALAGVNVRPLLEIDPAQFGTSGEGEAQSDLGDSATAESLQKSIAALEEREKAARGLQDQKEIAEEALKQWDQAMKAHRSEEAKRLAEMAFSAAQKAKNAALMKAARSASEQVETAIHQE